MNSTKDRKLRLKIIFQEPKMVFLKALKNLRYRRVRFLYRRIFIKQARASSFSFFKNRCVVTGHSSSVFYPFRVSRMVFKAAANYGLFYGFHKGSW